MFGHSAKVNVFGMFQRQILGSLRTTLKVKLLTEPKAAETNFLEDTMLAPTLASGSSVTSYSTA
jgi:hypothetical protein